VTGGSYFTALAGTGVGANAGTITVETGSVFVVGGTVKNSGIISLNGIAGANAALEIARDTTFQGGGKITLLSGGNQIRDVSPSGATLTNVDNTISGVGYISTNAPLVNQTNGVIDANGSGLVIQVSSLTNAGLLESTSTGGLVLQGPINNSASGVIGAFGAGSNVTLEPENPNGTVIEPGTLSGGTLKTSGGGKIILQDGETIDGSNGHTVTNTGSILVNDVNLLGTISNTGTIACGVLAVGSGGATLAGSGTVTLLDSNATIFGSGTSTTLTNQNTISGVGEIGGKGLLLINQGVIDATGTNPLIVDTGASAVTNSGTLEATNNATLFVASNVTNTGHLIANNGTDIFAGAVSGTGTATVQGAGSIEFGSTTTSNITFAAGADGTVTFDAASMLTGKLSVTGFTLGDTIDLADINFTGSGPTLTYSKGVLTVSDGTHTAKLNMIGNFTLTSFHAAPDGSGGTLITDPPLLGSAPPTSPPGLDHVVALFNQSIAAGFSDQQQQGVMNTNPLSQVVNNQEQFLAHPHHG
jgi:hypothetical protein